jgi:hypothetical protein
VAVGSDALVGVKLRVGVAVFVWVAMGSGLRVDVAVAVCDLVMVAVGERVKVAVGVFVLVEVWVAVLVEVGELGGADVRVGRGVLGCCVGLEAVMVAEGGTGVGMTASRVRVDWILRVAGGRSEIGVAMVVSEAVGEAVGEAVSVTFDVKVGVIITSAVDQ